MAKISVIPTERQSIPADGFSAEGKPRSRSDTVEGHFSLFGNSPAIQQIRYSIERVAPTSATVLITGESGTGKEVVARLLHEQSQRRRETFLPVNCGAISPNLVESEFFGFDKGSFTGALRDHKGYFECASGGTLFLDEITEMPIELQAKLLRVLETRHFMRVGSGREIETDVRIIAATNRSPEEAVKEGKLRADLLYRLQVFIIEMPRLAERGEDIELLALHFLDELNAIEDQEKMFSEKALSTLRGYEWPGNVRELKNAIHRAFILADHVIDQVPLPCKACSHAGSLSPVSRHVAEKSCSTRIELNIGCSLAEAEKELILATLSRCGGSKEKAANILGVSLKTLYNRLNLYSQQEEDSEDDIEVNSHLFN